MSIASIIEPLRSEIYSIILIRVCSLLQELVGSIPVGFDDYFTRRFPKLLIEVYKVISCFCRQEECFQKYFKSHVD